MINPENAVDFYYGSKTATATALHSVSHPQCNNNYIFRVNPYPMNMTVLCLAIFFLMILPVKHAFSQTLEISSRVLTGETNTPRLPDLVSGENIEKPEEYLYKVIKLVRAGKGEEALDMSRAVRPGSRLRNQIVWAMLEELSVLGDVTSFLTVLSENTGTECVSDLLIENVYLKFFLEPLWMLDLPGVFLRKRTNELLVAARYLTERTPNAAQAHFVHGFLLRQVGEYDQSIEAFGKAIETDAGFAQAYFFRGLSLIERGGFEPALQEMMKAMSLDPGNDHFNSLVPLLQLASWRLDEAEQTFLKEKSSTGQVLVSLAKADLGQFIKLLKGEQGKEIKRMALYTVLFLGMIPLLLAVAYLITAKTNSRSSHGIFESWSSLLALTALLLGITMVAFIVISLGLYRTPFAFVFPKLRLRLFLIAYIVTAVVWSAVVVVLAGRERTEGKQGLFRLSAGHAFLGVGAGIALFAVTWFIDYAIVPRLSDHLPKVLIQTRSEELIIRSFKGTPDFILLMVAVVLAAPVMEEIFFRGVLQGTVERCFGSIVAIILTSGVFAVIHMRAVLQLFIMGAVLAYLYWKTRNMTVPVLAHAVSNAVTIAVTLATTAVL